MLHLLSLTETYPSRFRRRQPHAHLRLTPTASSTTLLQPSQVLPNTTPLYPYGVPTIPHLSPAMISLFYGPSLFKLQTSYGLRPPIFPTSQYHPLASVAQIPCVHVPHYPWPYKNLTLPQPTLPPTFGMNRSLSGSSQHFQSCSPVDNTEDDSDTGGKPLFTHWVHVEYFQEVPSTEPTEGGFDLPTGSF